MEEIKYYRYHDARYTDSGTHIYISEFPVKRRTPKGAWIDNYGKEVFILDGEGKRFAHATKQVAMNSFIARKKRQRLIYQTRLRHVEQALYLAEYMKQNNKLLSNYESFKESDIPFGLPLADTC